jgi:hypothetical protein
MSIPVSYCALVKAVDHPETLPRLREAIQYNLKCGHFSMIGCRCEPPCRELTEQEADELQAKLGLPDDDEEE